MGNIESSENFWDNTVEIASRAVGDEPSYWDADYFVTDELYAEEYGGDAGGGGGEGGEEEGEEEEEERGRRSSSLPTATSAPSSPVSAPSAVANDSKDVGETAPSPSPPPPAPAASAASPSVVAPPEASSEKDSAAPSADASAVPSSAAQGEETETPHAAAISAAEAAADINISKSQIVNPVQPDAKLTSGGTTARVLLLRHGGNNFSDGPFAALFVLHILAVAAVIVYLDVLFLKDMNLRKLHNLERWFPQLCVAVGTGFLFGLLFQILFYFRPVLMARSTIGISSFLTFGASIMLIATSLPANLGLGIIWLVFSVCLSLYACWTSRRVEFAGKLLFFCMGTAREVSGIYHTSFWVALAASVWLVFWSFGVVSALSIRFAPLLILALLASLAWTLATLRNVICATTARQVAALYLGHEAFAANESLRTATSTWLGSICLGSLIVPIIHVLHGMARGLNRIHNKNEFMFSCADCFYNITSHLSKYANNWAYVQVALYDKPFMRASYDTLALFQGKKLNKVIERDLTSSFCVLTGISGGMVCVLVSGGWTFDIHKALTSSISVLSFCIGYFLVRMMMAVPHGIVCAHYVCYGEAPTSQKLVKSPVLERLKELLAEGDTEAAKRN